MTVTRRITITYEVDAELTAEVFDSTMLRRATLLAENLRIATPSFSSEPVIPSPEPLVGPS